MDEDETLKLLREQRQRLLELRASSGMGEIARAEQQRREALRLIGGPSALAGIFSCQGQPKSAPFSAVEKCTTLRRGDSPPKTPHAGIAGRLAPAFSPPTASAA